ncbi:hypothetical protein DFH27DRAFT_657339 [Peziza echinospora]|nr:hypothetical protein DFH27DRAFT_657339 [Peziza echinospora]
MSTTQVRTHARTHARSTHRSALAARVRGAEYLSSCALRGDSSPPARYSAGHPAVLDTRKVQAKATSREVLQALQSA